MTEQELQNKIGAMHLRFLDDQVHYEEFVNVLMCYSESSDNYGQIVNAISEWRVPSLHDPS